MNTFELVFSVETIAPGFALSAGQEKVSQQIWVDDEQLDAAPAVNLNALVQSLFHPGRFRIFTCDNADCTGSWGDVLVRHEQGVIHWRLQRPVWPTQDRTTQGCDACICSGVRPGKWMGYTFDRDQMLADIASALCVIGEQTSPDAIYSPHGFERKHLEALKPYGKFADIPGTKHCGKNLFLLVDEKDQFLLEGRFVSLNELDLDASTQQRFQSWLQERDRVRTDPNKRQEWLEGSRALIHDVARSALPEGAAIHLIAQRNTSEGALDPWSAEWYSFER